jgi:hypothetical protein
MAVTITGGWLSGSLPDDTGRQWPIVQHRQSPTGAQGPEPNLVLHTTETDSYVPVLKFASNFQCGEGKIGQHIQLGFSGDAVFVHDRENIGIEMVGRSKLGLWLPDEPTLGPTVALVAWLHQGRIRTGLRRPPALDARPLVLDRMPAAVKTYYRRHISWPATGVYGHVDLPDNDHWDPGSFNYPRFFSRVEAVLGGPQPGDEMSEYADGQLDYLDNPNRSFPLPVGWSVDKKNGYKVAKALASTPTPKPGPPGPVDPNSHKHAPGVTVAGAAT